MATTQTLFVRFDDAMRLNVALMDEFSTYDDQLFLLLDVKKISEAITGARKLFEAVGGILPRTLSEMPRAQRGSRLFAIANRLLHFCSNSEVTAFPVERDPLTKSYSDLITELVLAKHIAVQVRKGMKIRNLGNFASRLREVGDLYRLFRYEILRKLSERL